MTYKHMYVTMFLVIQLLFFIIQISISNLKDLK